LGIKEAESPFKPLQVYNLTSSEPASSARVEPPKRLV
jgi:hypothetical protein